MKKDNVTKMMQEYGIAINSLNEDMNSTASNIKKLSKIFENLLKEYNELQNVNNNYSKLDYSNISAFKVFSSALNFMSYAEDLYNVRYWSISAQKESDRINYLKNVTYFNDLKKDFNSKKLCAKPITNSQALSFLDTISLMYNMFELIGDSPIINDINVIMEYVFKYDSGNHRADYILTYRDMIFILEFGITTKDKIKQINSEKTKQVKEYENLMRNDIDFNKVQVFSMPVLYQAEADDQSQ